MELSPQMLSDITFSTAIGHNNRAAESSRNQRDPQLRSPHIERGESHDRGSVDVVTGGATAAYGADALGGVTNFILDREFQGLKLNAGTGMNEFGHEGKNWNVSVAGGKRLGERLNIVGSFEERHVDQIVRNPADLDPSWFQRWGQIQNPAWSAADPPGTNPRRLTVPWVAPAGLHVNGKIGGVPATSALANMKFNDTGTAIVPFDRGTLSDASWISGGPDAAISNLTQLGGPSGSEVSQRTAFLSLKYAVSDSIDVFFDLLDGHVESNSAQVVSGASMSGPWSPTVFRENAYLPAAVRTIMVAENRPSFLLAKGGSYPGELDVYNTSNSRNEFDTKLFRVGFDWTIIPSSADSRFGARNPPTPPTTSGGGATRSASTWHSEPR